MAQVGETTESAARYASARVTGQVKPANKHNNRGNLLLTSIVFSRQDDAALIDVAERGAEEAFEVLVRRYQARILRIAWRFTRNREDAEDITQQTFQKAFLNLRRSEGNAHFYTWLTRIAINESLMWVRRRHGSREVSLEMSITNHETLGQSEPADFAPNPEETCLRLERRQILFAANNRLRPKLRTAMELREFAELSTKETAVLMGLSVETVKSRLIRGRTKLRAILKPDVGS
jgi:RNA polymerase sigma-70 factor, ECF subfamily